MLTKQKPIFIALSSLSIASLIGSFGFPLQRLELYRQVELSAFKVPVTKTYILTENDRDYPLGFDRSRARKFAQIHEPATLQKILLLTTAIAASVGALLIGNKLVPAVEYEEEISRIKAEGAKELKLKALKQDFALKNKASQMLFLDSMRELMDSFDSIESEIQTVDELNALYEQTEENLLPKEENQVQPASSVDFRATFPEQMDSTSWKACVKAIADGATREEVIKDVLGGGDVAGSYFDFLKGKFL